MSFKPARSTTGSNFGSPKPSSTQKKMHDKQHTPRIVKIPSTSSIDRNKILSSSLTQSNINKLKKTIQTNQPSNQTIDTLGQDPCEHDLPETFLTTRSSPSAKHYNSAAELQTPLPPWCDFSFIEKDPDNFVDTLINDPMTEEYQYLIRPTQICRSASPLPNPYALTIVCDNKTLKKIKGTTSQSSLKSTNSSLPEIDLNQNSNAYFFVLDTNSLSLSLCNFFHETFCAPENYYFLSLSCINIHKHISLLSYRYIKMIPSHHQNFISIIDLPPPPSFFETDNEYYIVSSLTVSKYENQSLIFTEELLDWSSYYTLFQTHIIEQKPV